MKPQYARFFFNKMSQISLINYSTKIISLNKKALTRLQSNFLHKSNEVFKKTKHEQRSFHGFHLLSVFSALSVPIKVFFQYTLFSSFFFFVLFFKLSYTCINQNIIPLNQFFDITGINTVAIEIWKYLRKKILQFSQTRFLIVY